MTLRRLERRRARETLPDMLLGLAASLSGAETADEALGRLTRGLSDEDISYALLVQLADGSSLKVERATLPLVPEVWGRPLRLPRLAAAATRGRALAYSDIDEAFTEALRDGSRQPLLKAALSGTLIVAPLRVEGGQGAVLCLSGSQLEEDTCAAAWGLALQLGAALREAGLRQNASAARTTAGRPGAAVDLPLFHELTRRLSHSLSSDEVVGAALEALAPAVDFDLAATIACDGGCDVARVYAAGGASPELAGNTAAGALDAFVRLTGEKHRSCERPAFEMASLATGAAPRARATELVRVLDAPLVTDGEVVGLLRIGSGRQDAFDGAADRLFYTVANQVSLALERVAAQRSAERAHLASLAESLSDGIVLVDAGLKVTSLNSAAQGQLEILAGAQLPEGATLSGTPLAELAQEALSTGRSTALRELSATTDRSPRAYLMAMAAPLAGSPEGSAAVVIVRDVSEERLMQERLLQSEKMVSVGQLVSGVAHELNNPLTGIMGFAQLALGRDLDERTQNDMETIHTEAERAAKIVQNLLSFARRKRSDKELADLNSLLERVLELRHYDLTVRNIEVVRDLDDDLPPTMVDADQIQQVFLNIIINAEQAMRDLDGGAALTVRTRRQVDAVRVSLQDGGPGMPPETLRRIFDPFFTTKEVGEGTGLGLTVSYGIIDEHGGRIWAESQPGRGTTFIIELPVVEGVRPRPAEAAAEEPAPVASGCSILVVDDEESIQRLLGSILEMDGHRVETASNGREALERIDRGFYDVIITDIKMPDLDGPALYQRLVDTDHILAERTIFITGDTVSPETRRFLEEVPNPCLAKPFRVREVRETIHDIIEGGT